MRRLLLTLTIFTFAGWSQPAQQQAHPPIVINNVPPHEGFWMGLLKLAIPTIAAAALASGITLYGVNKTHKHQATENEANRRHLLQVEIAKAEIAAKYKSQDRRWEFRKDVYANLINAGLDFVPTFTEAQSMMDAPTSFSSESKDKIFLDLNTAIKRFVNYAYLAPLAMADEALLLVEAAGEQLLQSYTFDEDKNLVIHQDRMRQLGDLLKQLQAAGRKDLWGTSEPEAK